MALPPAFARLSDDNDDDDAGGCDLAHLQQRLAVLLDPAVSAFAVEAAAMALADACLHVS